MEKLTQKDKFILRGLAVEQLEYAKSPQMEILKKEWLLHNTCRGSRPMIHVECATFENEIIPPLLQCEGEDARNIEKSLYRNFINHKLFEDDFPVKDYYPIRPQSSFTLFGVKPKIEYTSEGIGHHFVPIIHDLEQDFHMLAPSVQAAYPEETQKMMEHINEIFGDILPAKLIGSSLCAVPTQKIVHLMGMETMYFSMHDYPELFLKMMDMVADAYLSYFNFLSVNSMILPTVADQSLNQGSWCFTDELPSKPELVHFPSDVWGFMDSQETVGISTEMFSRFIFPCYEKIAKHFGLLSYGCCEPVHDLWDACLSQLSNLKKISISPWCDEEKMGEKLDGKKIIYHRKPSPNYLGVDKALDEKALALHIDKTIKASKGCPLEITQRDVYTVHNNPQKVKRFVEIIRSRCS